MILRDSFLDIESLLLALLHGNTLYFSLSLTRKRKKIIVTFVGSCQAQGIRAVRETIGPRKKCILLIPRTSCTSSTLIFNRNTEGKWELRSIIICIKLGSVAGPVIQANGRLSFEDDVRSGSLLYCVSQ